MSGSTNKQAIARHDAEDMSVWNRACKRALGGGMSGAMAMFLQVGTLMSFRTTMNYQYRNGTTTREAFLKLYNEGGIRRFYRGIGPALLQGPLSRFGDTAANAGVITFLNGYESTRELPIVAKTAVASAAAAAWRIFIMPIDTSKTMLQVNGAKGVTMLMSKLRSGGIPILYHGALGASLATFVGHMPWFTTYNFLDAKLPHADGIKQKLARSAVIGFTASVVSDTISNSIRVVKTTKQTFENPISYREAVKTVIEKDGITGLFGRGLQTRIISNGFQGLMFSVLWKLFDDAWFKDTKDRKDS